MSKTQFLEALEYITNNFKCLINDEALS